MHLEFLMIRFYGFCLKKYSGILGRYIDIQEFGIGVYDQKREKGNVVC